MNRTGAMPRAWGVCGTFFAVVCLQIPTAWLLGQGQLWLGLLSSQLLAMGLPLLVVIWWRGYDYRAMFPFPRPTLRALAAVIAITIGVAMFTEQAVEFWQRFFDAPPLFEERIPELLEMHTLSDVLLRVGLLACLPALMEESFFRGFCQTALARHYGPVAGVLGAAGLFALAHNNFAYFHLYFLLGVYLGYLRHRSGGMWWPIVAHAVNNGWTLLMKSLFAFSS